MSIQRPDWYIELVARAKAEEREACATVADALQDRHPHNDIPDIAAAIRART